MYKLQKTYHFDAAHKLKDTDRLTTKKCLNLHGHRWSVKVEITTKQLFGDMVIDFGKIKKIIDLLDHKNLNKVLNFNPTAENIAYFLYNAIEVELPQVDKKLKVTVEESPGAKVAYYG